MKTNELHSRSKGILETEVLNDKTVTIVGLGSFGGEIALELAKAGVGHFHLFDFDTLEIHNIARHICYIKDVGRKKTDAVAECIVGKNPYAEIVKHEIDVSKNPDVFAEAAKASDLVICATDNNPSRFMMAKIVNDLGKICIYGRAYTRAEGGDVFIQRKGGACYSCLVGNVGAVQEEITDEMSARRNGTIPAYVSKEDADAVVQVGLSSDIEPITNMMVKLSLVELSRNVDSGIKSLEDEFTYNYYIWANRRDRKFSNWHSFPRAGALPTIMRWYGANIPKQEGCASCSENLLLDTGEEFEKLLNIN